MRLNETHLKILESIGSTEETTFGELCGALGDAIPTDKSEWRELFENLDWLDKNEFVEIDRTNGKIDSLILTESGANLIRSRLDAKRPLFNSSN